ncbi:MAG TPA: metal ABC transporter ATP-binding protein [Selenomonadales bacterium]|nr:metal ABC transporter ATP-binding protein [Selenomonadales bacterium]
MYDVKLSEVTFFYGDDAVLHNFSLTVAAGSFVAVVGPNGAGKSTLLKIIAGILRPARGSVMVAGKDIAASCRSGEVGYVPQIFARNAASFPATVEEIVALGLVAGRAKKTGKEAARHIVSHMLDLVGIEPLRGKLIGELSGGQQQRVMVARALAGNPGLLLLDEPTSGVDQDTSAKLFALLGTLNQNLGITIIAVSHDIEKITRTATHVACINRGLCCYEGAAEFRRVHAQSPHLSYFVR